MDTTFTPPAPYGVTMLVTPPVACPLADALATTLSALQRDAERAGLPTVSLHPSCLLQDGRLHCSYLIMASAPGLGYPVQGYGATLAQAEEAFYSDLSRWENEVYEADPCRYVDAQIESMLQLEAHA